MSESLERTLVMGAILLIHYLVGIAAFLWWRDRPAPDKFSSNAADLFGFFSPIPMAAISYWLLHPDGSQVSGWFLALSVATMGLLPIVTLLPFVLFGRMMGRVFHSS